MSSKSSSSSSRSSIIYLYMENKNNWQKVFMFYDRVVKSVARWLVIDLYLPHKWAAEASGVD